MTFTLAIHTRFTTIIPADQILGMHLPLLLHQYTALIVFSSFKVIYIMSSDGAVVCSALPSNGNGACHLIQAHAPEYYASTAVLHSTKSGNGAVRTLSSNGQTPTDPAEVMHTKSSNGGVAVVHSLSSDGAHTPEIAPTSTAAMHTKTSSTGAITLSANGSVIPTTIFQRQQGQGTLKERLRNGEQLYGSFCVSFAPVMAEILGWAGYDFVVVDMEHGPGDIMTAIPMLRALASTNTPAILRLPENNSIWAKKALDIGPAGIMFPKVEDAADAVRAVRSTRYPPKGIRGAAYPLVRASRYGLDPTYLNRCEDDLLIMCQVETQGAVKKIAEIAAVDGVDCIQTGPRDLRSDMGLLREPHDLSPLDLLRIIEGKVKASGVYLGGFATSDDPPTKLLELGYNMVIGAYDVALLKDSAVADIKRAKRFQHCLLPPKCNDSAFTNGYMK